MAGATEVTKELVNFCICEQVLLRIFRPSIVAILLFVNLSSPKGTAIVWANLDLLFLFLNVL